MKLYDLPRDQGIKIKLKLEKGGTEMITFGHLDGMYSYCEAEDGSPCHLAAATPLKKSEDGDYYEIDKEVSN